MSRRASRTAVIARGLAFPAALWQVASVQSGPEQPPKLLTVQDVAQLLRTTPNGVRRRVTRGSIPARCVVPDFRPLRFYANEIHALVGLTPATVNEVHDG